MYVLQIIIPIILFAITLGDTTNVQFDDDKSYGNKFGKVKKQNDKSKHTIIDKNKPKGKKHIEDGIKKRMIYKF